MNIAKPEHIRQQLNLIGNLNFRPIDCVRRICIKPHINNRAAAAVRLDNRPCLSMRIAVVVSMLLLIVIKIYSGNVRLL